MQDSSSQLGEIFEGLSALAEGAFPKRCPRCDKQYDCLETLISQTTPVETLSGLQEVQQGLTSQVSMNRRCGCGANLSELFDDRRSHDELGLKRRQLFDRLLTLLTGGGMDEATAKPELLKVMRGEGSSLLSKEQLQRFFA